MAAHALLAQNEPYEAPEAANAPLPLTDCLNRKLAELRAKRCKALWIECSKADLTTLVLEGAEDSVVLHPDPTVDRAWYWGVEIRCAADRELTWVFLKGEVENDEDAVSAHVVSPH
ncbi:MAG: hypothetical protein JWQ29_1034 [Phenylobacterium sp.]|nr:hypothetical protein [Phenylobacterium sp.]